MEITPLPARAQAPPSQDFSNLHATGPVMWSQVVAQNPKPADLQMNMLEMIPQIVAQVLIALTQKANPQTEN